MKTMMIVVWGVLSIAACPAWSKDHFFTLGGGYSPRGNQISLEKNVLYFQRLLHEMGRDAQPQYYLFADGTDPGRDLQYREPQSSDHEVYYLLSGIFNPSDEVYHGYRSSAVPRVAGACSTQNVDSYFDETASKLTGEDRLFIYFTGHGGRGGKGNPQNTRMHLWDGQEMRMKELAARLDKVPAGVPVVMVMVQCFSGGFANVIFNDGDPAQGLSPESRAGFFATVFDRGAAGCTADIDEADYQEYSSWFWAALSGKTRMGETLPRCDYDGDGVTCFAEAHAFALLHSDSVDISVKTSDALLRQFSSIDLNTQKDGQPVPALLTPDSDYHALLAAADPYEKAVLEGLGSQLQFFGAARTQAARELAGVTEERRQALKDERKRLVGEFDVIRGKIGGVLKARWPELADPWHPHLAVILATESKNMIALIKGHPQFHRYTEVIDRIGAIDAESLALERKWAKCQRFLRAAENVALAANLSKLTTPEVCKKYAELMKAECGTLK